jgi:hypothetical protein
MDAEAGDMSRWHDSRGDDHDEAPVEEEEEEEEEQAGEGEGEGEEEDEQQQHRRRPMALPADLPRSLDDRQSYSYGPPQETEYYDAWQGASTTRLL